MSQDKRYGIFSYLLAFLFLTFSSLSLLLKSIYNIINAEGDKMLRILLVEDDRTISDVLSQFLLNEGFEAIPAFSQKDALSKMELDFDLALIDITLPDGNGFSVCRAVKEKGDIPVIFLTACTDEFSVVTGLDMGGDDYIEKPYRPHELVSRIKSVLRRFGKTQSVIKAGNIVLDTVKGVVSKNGNDLFLSALEYRILLFFFNNPKTVLTRSRLLSEIWDMGGEFVSDNTLTVYIKRLREKVEDDPQNPKIIQTVRGIGYKLGEQ